jgi:Protein of unknown function (DUF1552)
MRERMSRRMFARTAGATLWLPFLPSALPRHARAADPPAEPRRAIWWFLPNGFVADFVVPTIEGSGYELPPTLAPLEPVKERVSVLSGLHNYAAKTDYLHEEVMGTLLGDNWVENFREGTLDGGITVDQHAAATLSGVTPFPSLELGTGEPYTAAVPNSNGDILYRTLSYSSPTTPVPTLSDPKTVFDLMFAGVDPKATQVEIDRRTELRLSLLDSVADRTKPLRARLNAADRIKLDQFTTGVRALELQIAALAALECQAGEEPGVDLGFEEKIGAMHDLITVALQCDFTRVATFMLGASTSTTVYDFLGISTDHHTLSHDYQQGGDPETQLLSIWNYQVGRFAELVAQLAEVQTDTGDLLENTMLFFCSELGEPNHHRAFPMTFLLAGAEAGGVVQGHHRVFTEVPHSNAWISALDFLGVDSKGYGTTHTGPLDLAS